MIFRIVVVGLKSVKNLVRCRQFYLVFHRVLYIVIFFFNIHLCDQFIIRIGIDIRAFLAVYCMRQLHATICLFSKYFQVLYIFAQIFKYFSFFCPILPFFCLFWPFSGNLHACPYFLE